MVPLLNPLLSFYLHLFYHVCTPGQFESEFARFTETQMLNNDYPPKAIAKVHIMTTWCIIGSWATGQIGNCCTVQNISGWVMLTRNTFCPKYVIFSLEITDVPNIITPVILLQDTVTFCKGH